MGACAFDIIVDYIDHISDGCVVEIGSTRGEGSTYFFMGFLHKSTRHNFVTIDINHETTRHLEKYKRMGNIQVLTGNGVVMLDQIAQPIAYAYLDNFDLIRPGTENHPAIREQVNKYKKDFNLDMHNTNCYQTHLEQTQKIVTRCAEKCIIQFDDTHFKEGWVGKGSTAVPWLLDRGWTVLPQHTDPWTSNDYVALSNFQI